MIKRCIFGFLILALSVGLSRANEENKSNGRLIFSPLAFYSPETRLGLGAAGSYIFRLAGDSKNTRPSFVSPIVIYTLEKQFKVQANTGVYFKDNDFRVEAEIKFENYPNKFFGIGCLTPDAGEEIYTSKGINFQAAVLKKLLMGFHIGLGFHFTDWEITETEAGGQLAAGDIPGSKRGTISGIRFLLERDSRDHLFFPMMGDLFKFEARSYLDFLGSTYEFTTFTLDLRKYFTFFSSHVFAVQALCKVQSGTVPFLQLAQLGGQYTMRGYFEGRFRDKYLLAFQAEYRMPLVWRLGVVGFVGFGNVADKFNLLNIGELKSSYGFGLRFLFSKSEKIRLRLDWGFGKGTSGFYASIYEAF